MCGAGVCVTWLQGVGGISGLLPPAHGLQGLNLALRALPGEPFHQTLQTILIKSKFVFVCSCILAVDETNLALCFCVSCF